jgi:two-component system NtrC family sensor kinase
MSTDDAAPRRDPQPADLFALIERAKQEWEGSFDAIREGIAVIGPDGRVRRANRAVASMVAQDVRRLPGQRCCEIWPHHQTQGCPQTAPLARPRVFDSESLPGRQLEERSHALPDGGAVLVIEDVTEREAVARNVARLHAEMREANHALRESLDALAAEQRRTAQAESVASLAHLAAGLAHEINNPLGIITQNLGHAEADGLALADLGGAGGGHGERVDALRDELVSALADARAGAARIGRIVKAIGEFGDGGRDDPGGVDGAAALRAAAADAAERLGRAGSDVQLQISGCASIRGARRDLERALGQLIANALEASPAHPIWVELAGDGQGEVQFRVVDLGPGLPDTDPARLYDPFVSYGRGPANLGLGLTLAKALAERMGGSVTLERAEGGETVATLTLAAVQG